MKKPLVMLLVAVGCGDNTIAPDAAMPDACVPRSRPAADCADPCYDSAGPQLVMDIAPAELAVAAPQVDSRPIRVALFGVIAFLVVAISARPARGSQPLSTELRHVLTQIDEVATRDQIQQAHGSGDPLPLLASIARDASKDFGVRLRAIGALPAFCSPSACRTGDPAHDAIVAMFQNDEPNSGRRILLLRAAIEALAATRAGDPGDVSLLVPYLDHPSRDVRTATARALRDLCNTSAIVPLRNRYQAESVPQVRLAISSALRDLAQCVE